MCIRDRVKEKVSWLHQMFVNDVTKNNIEFHDG